MPQKKSGRIDFEISLTKLKWCPKHLSEVPEAISRAFEREITIQEIQPIIGTDHVKDWVLKEDKDIPVFYNAPNMMQEWIAEKLIRCRIPDGLIPNDFQPKKTKILAKGERIAKFFGEDSCSTRRVECSLKLFSCGHFYLKLTLPGSGASPHWTVYEGRWVSTEKGLRLEHLLRYSWQLPSSRRPATDFNLEACKAQLATSLAWDGESERQLNGNLPAVVGTEDFFWVELVREGQAKGAAKIRWNEDLEDLQVVKERAAAAAAAPEPAPSEPPEAQAAAKPKPTPKPAPLPPQQRPVPAPRFPEADVPSASSRDEGVQRRRPPEPAPASRPPASVPLLSKGVAEEDNESPLPLYICFGLFVLMAGIFCYWTWEERSH